jgi:F-type H+-transporting ATPase subunit epsilon
MATNDEHGKGGVRGSGEAPHTHYRLKLVLVTPETTLVDEPVSALRFPLFDGQIGILPGRAPLIGRLGYGELNVTHVDGSHASYFVDGGFVQVKQGIVSLLTDRALTREQIDRTAAAEKLREAVARVARSDAEANARFRDQERARQMLAMATGR